MLATAIGLKKHVSPKAMRRTFNDRAPNRLNSSCGVTRRRRSRMIADGANLRAGHRE
jgi:hypothetical protein